MFIGMFIKRILLVYIKETCLHFVSLKDGNSNKSELKQLKTPGPSNANTLCRIMLALKQAWTHEVIL